MNDSAKTDTRRLEKAGIFSLLLHLLIVGLLVLSAKSATLKDEHTVYEVRILPLAASEESLVRLPVPPPRTIAETQVRTKAADKKNVEVFTPPTLAVLTEKERFVEHREDEEASKRVRELNEEKETEEPKRIKEPVLLPIAIAPPRESKEEKETIGTKEVKEPPLPVAMASVKITSEIEKTEPFLSTGTPGKQANGSGTSRDGPGVGTGGIRPGITAMSPGNGQGGSPGGGSETGPGVEYGIFRWGGHGEGSVSGQGSYGKALGDGSGRPGNGMGEGQGSGGGSEKRAGSGTEGSGNGKGMTAGLSSGPAPGKTEGSGSGARGNLAARPRYSQNRSPVYPAEARKKGYQGKVLLVVEILSDGLVGKIGVEKSSGYEILDRAALEAVKEWKFIPGMKEGIAVPFTAHVPITFQVR